MTDPVAELVERGLALSPGDRALLVELLRESLDEPLSPEVAHAWRLELRSRVAAYERGEATLHDADQVIAEATQCKR